MKFSRTEPLSLEKTVGQLEKEARMVLPGIQALFGFQLIAVFSDRFERLDPLFRNMHLASLIGTTISVLLVLTPAAYHRQAEPNSISSYFCKLGSKLLTLSMFPLAIAISLDLDVVCMLSLDSPVVAHTVGAISLFSFLWFWFGFPRIKKP